MDRILVADDQEDILESLRLLLKGEGFSVDAVSSPQAVLRSAQLNQYDVLLLDMNYARDTTSGTEGLELLSLIQKFDDTLPVVLMTAWGSVELAVEAMRTGGRDFVEKPWDNARLLTMLRRNIKSGRQRRRDVANNRQTVREARETQERLLPVELPQLPEFDIKAAWKPAATLSGDYYDVILLDDRTLAFCIADVAGKDLPAALLMSHIQATVRAHAPAHRSPALLCSRLNRAVLDNVVTGRFITFFYGLLDTTSGRLVYTSAGHVPPLLATAGGEVRCLDTGGPVLGVVEDARYDEGEAMIEPGAVLLLLTDGITEAENQTGVRFEDHADIAQWLRQNRELTSESLKDTLLHTLSTFTGGILQDDVTVLVISRTGDGSTQDTAPHC